MSNHCSVRIKEGGHGAPLLTFTQAMQCYSWSLPAGKEGSCPMYVDESNSICRSCYAMINRYAIDLILSCQWVRLAWTQRMLSTREGYGDWVNIMRMCIGRYCDGGYFRVHDSGDFYNPSYIIAWHAVVHSLPNVKFWFPTRAWVFPKWLVLLHSLASEPNATVRPSALYFDEVAPCIYGLDVGSTVVERPHGVTKSFRIRGLPHAMCPKSVNHSSCEAEQCRACWSKDVTRGIAYLKSTASPTPPPSASSALTSPPASLH